MSLKFYCLNCGATLVVKFLKKGERAKCRSCGIEVYVPDNAIEVDLSEWSKAISEENPNMEKDVAEQMSNSNITKPKFQAATKMGVAISLMGWSIMILTVIATIYVFGSASGTSKLLGIVVLLIGCPLGIQIVVGGQLLQAIIAIENNTDKTVQLLEKFLYNDTK